MENNIRMLSVKWNGYTIGYLMKEDGVGYLFKYDSKGMQTAKLLGYTYLIGFKDTRRTYAARELFPAFKSRVPTKQRRDLDEKLKNAGINQYDEFSYLAATGGKLNTDAISLEETEIQHKKISKTKATNDRTIELV